MGAETFETFHQLIRPIDAFMKKYLLLFFIICSSHTLFAQQEYREGFLPKHLTEEEKERLHEINRDRQATDPPAQPARAVAEFEPMSGALIRYPLWIPYSLVALLSETVEVVTIVADESVKNQAISDYQNHGVNMDNASFLIAPTNSVWTRDYGPWYIFDSNNEFGIMDFEYDRPRPQDNAIPEIVANENNINYFHMGLVHTGGDYMADGMGVAASTLAAYSVNSGNFTPAQVDSIMHLYLGIEQYHVVPNIHGGLSHIDTWAKFLAPDKILIREVYPDHPYYEQAEQAVNYFASQISSYGRPFQVYRVLTPNNEPYTNSLILNDRVYVPLTGSPYDDAAIQSYQEAMPGYTIFGVPFSGWGSNDALHCRVREIPDREMLYIHHQPIVHDQQSHHDYEVHARIIPMSGEALFADSLLVYYRVDDGDFAHTTMTATDDDWYTAAIPQQDAGTDISYYIFAADASGRRERHPYIGAADPHRFYVAGPLAFEGATVDDSEYGNDNGYFQPGETVEIVVNYMNQGDETLFELQADLFSHSEYINIHPPGQATHESMDPGESLSFRFVVSSSLSTPDAYLAAFHVEAYADDLFLSLDSFAVEIKKYVVEEYLLQETFDDWLPDGWEVTSSSGQINWQQSNSSVAGGSPPEARFHYNPSTDAVQRLITPPMNTAGHTLLQISFRHAIDDYQGGYNLRVETSGDGGDNWSELISYPDNDMSAKLEEILIDNSHVGSESFRVAWTFEGDSWDINTWHVDDVMIGVITADEVLAHIQGQVSLVGGTGQLEEVWITAGQHHTSPDENGFFDLVVPAGVYDVTATLENYVPQTITDVAVEVDSPATIDFELLYMAPPISLEYDLINDDIFLSWEMADPVFSKILKTNKIRYSQRNKSQHPVSDRSLTNFNIYRSMGYEDFTLAGTSTSMEYVDSPAHDGIYHYYVTAIYEEVHESNPSDTITVDVVLHDGTVPDLMEAGLQRVYPNPFSSQTTIAFYLDTPDFVAIRIYDMQGTLIRTLANNSFDQGKHHVLWDGLDSQGAPVAGGLYLVRYNSGRLTDTKPLLFIKE